MDWAKAKSLAIGSAVATVLVVHVPPVVTDPLYRAVAQMRQSYANTDPQSDGTSSNVVDVVSTAVKKMVK